jgi:hypothetical protein
MEFQISSQVSIRNHDGTSCDGKLDVVSNRPGSNLNGRTEFINITTYAHQQIAWSMKQYRKKRFRDILIEKDQAWNSFFLSVQMQSRELSTPDVKKNYPPTDTTKDNLSNE